jgi:hypothetical protein
MVRVTNAAKRQLKAVAEERELDPGKFLRLAVPPAWTGEGDFGIVIDARGGMDVDIKLGDRTVLLVEQVVDEQLLRSILDFKKPADGARFTLDVF